MKIKQIIIIDREELYELAIAMLREKLKIDLKEHGYFWNNNGELQIEIEPNDERTTKD